MRILLIAAAGLVVVVGCSDDSAESELSREAAVIELTDREIGGLIAECARNEGVVVEVNEAGSLESQIVDGVDHVAIFERCSEDLAERGLIPGVPDRTPEFLDAEYDRLLVLADCVMSEGQEVDPPPSKESFVESDGRNWHPYAGLGSLSSADFAAVNEACPQDLGS